MKKLLASLAGAVMLLTPGLEAQARTPWVKVVTNPSGTASAYISNVRRVDGEPHSRRFDYAYKESGKSVNYDERFMDCSTGQEWFWSTNSEKWIELNPYLPGTFGEATFEYVCPNY